MTDAVENVAIVPVGPVQVMKDELASKETAALAATPDGMKFVGWVLDGWITSCPLYDPLARAAYTFEEPTL